jgi:hypothetical protein
MATLLEIPTSGGAILIAVREPGEGVEAVGILDAAVRKVDRSLDSALSIVGDVVRSTREALDGAPVSEAELQLGLNFTATGNAYLIEGAAQAALSLRVKVRLIE